MDAHGFNEVETPILSSLAGGALAKPFLTQGSVALGKDLSLRIAPELFLKARCKKNLYLFVTVSHDLFSLLFVFGVKPSAMYHWRHGSGI